PFLQGMSRATRGLARIAISSGDYRTAENRFRESLVHAHSIRDRDSAFLANLGLADVARLMGQIDRAREFLNDADRVAHDLDRHLLIELGSSRILMEEEELAEAKKKLDRVYLQTEAKPDLDRIRRLAALYAGQLILLYSPTRTPPGKDQLIEISSRLGAA